MTDLYRPPESDPRRHVVITRRLYLYLIKRDRFHSKEKREKFEMEWTEGHVFANKSTQIPSGPVILFFSHRFFNLLQTDYTSFQFPLLSEENKESGFIGPDVTEQTKSRLGPRYVLSSKRTALSNE